MFSNNNKLGSPQFQMLAPCIFARNHPSTCCQNCWTLMELVHLDKGRGNQKVER